MSTPITAVSAVDAGMVHTHDLIIIGAGPAGMAAAAEASSLGLKTLVLDEQPRPGGQIYRNISAARSDIVSLLGPDYAHGVALASALEQSGAEVRAQTLVWDIAKDLTISAQHHDRSFQVRAPQVIVASGAMERPSPIPGWTLPGVLNAGAAQIALKTSAQIPEGRVVLVGCGPLLLLVACQLLEAGADLVAIVETAPRGNRKRALRHIGGALSVPGMLKKGLSMLAKIRAAKVPMFVHATNVRFEPVLDKQRLGTVCFEADDVVHRIDADVALLHHGVIPNTQITRLLRVDHSWDAAQLAWKPVTDAWGATSLSGLRVAGDGGGISGALAAEFAGRIAAIGAAQALGRIDARSASKRAAPLRAKLQHQQKIRPFLDALYQPPAWLIDCPDETIVCRCEEVSAGKIREMARLGCQGPNQTKFFSRCGMGPCQGRMCGTTVTQLLAQTLQHTPEEVGAYSIRSPLKPISMASLVAIVPPAEAKQAAAH